MRLLKHIYMVVLMLVLLVGSSIAFTGCNKDKYSNGKNGSNVYVVPEPTSTAFKAELLSYNVPQIEGYAWTWKIIRDEQNQKQDLSHFDFVDGYLYNNDENYYDKLSNHVIGAYYSSDGGVNWKKNGAKWSKDASTRICFVGDILKFEAGGDNLLVKLILDEEFETAKKLAVFKTGGRIQCGIIEFLGVGCHMNKDDVIAWSAGNRYVSKGNWATYTQYTKGTVKLYAGKTLDAGTVNFSAVSGRKVTITITLNPGFRLELDQNNNIKSEAIKVQGYTSAPSGNPAPNLFTCYKGTSLTFDVEVANFYGVHLDVERKDDCPE